MEENQRRLPGFRIMEDSPETFYLTLGYHHEGEPFITTLAIRNAIRQSGMPVGYTIGRFVIRINHGAKMMITKRVYPRKLIVPAYTPLLFEEIGLGNLAERKIEKILENRYPNYQISSSLYPSPERQIQFVSRGRKVHVPLPIREAAELTRKQIVHQFQKNKAKILNLRRLERARHP